MAMTSGWQADWRGQYPFTSRYLQLGRHRLHYVDEGRGPAVLMVHGNPTWSFYWRALIADLREDHRCVAVDHLGCGLSDKPSRSAYRYDLAQRIDDLCEVVQQLGLDEVTLVAHDWGGPIGLGTVQRMPERFRRIILLNTGAFPPPYVPWRILACRLPLVGTLAVRGLNLFARGALRMAMADATRLTAAARAGLVAPYASWRQRVAIDGFIRDIPLSPRHPTWGLLARIEAGLPALAEWPILLVWGMKDWCFRPECLRRLAAVWPAAEVHALADCGHYVMEEAPHEVVPRVRAFLARTARLGPVASQHRALGGHEHAR
jgi:haloalkane dehalogenase